LTPKASEASLLVVNWSVLLCVDRKYYNKIYRITANGHLQSHKSKDGNMPGSSLLKDLQSAVGTEHHAEMFFCICVFMFDIVLFVEQSKALMNRQED